MTPEYLNLKQEKLDVDKKWVRTEEVTWHKEVIIKEECVIIPVKREELVVERKYFCQDLPDQIIKTESIRIPLREERFEILKKPYTLEEVNVYKIQKQRNHPANATISKEVVMIKQSQDKVTEIRESR